MNPRIPLLAAVLALPASANAAATFVLTDGSFNDYALANASFDDISPTSPLGTWGQISFVVSDAAAQRGQLDVAYSWGFNPSGDVGDLLHFDLGSDDILPAYATNEGLPSYLQMHLTFGPGNTASGGSLSYGVDDFWGFHLSGSSDAFSGNFVDGLGGCWYGDCEASVRILDPQNMPMPEPATIGLLLLPMLYVVRGAIRLTGREVA